MGRLNPRRETKIQGKSGDREITVATHNVGTMAVDGTHGVGRALDVLSVHDRLGRDIIGLKEIRTFNLQPSWLLGVMQQ